METRAGPMHHLGLTSEPWVVSNQGRNNRGVSSFQNLEQKTLSYCLSSGFVSPTSRKVPTLSLELEAALDGDRQSQNK